MSARSIGELLVELGPRAVPVKERSSERVVPFDRTMLAAAPVRQEEAKEKLDEAYQRGRRDGHATAVAEYESQLKDLAAGYESRRTEDRMRWAVDQADRLVGLLADGYRTLEAGMSESIAQILQPFLEHAIRQKAIDEFRAQLARIVADGSAPTVRISGPADLIAAVRIRMSACPIAIEFVSGEGSELTAVCDQTKVETHMRAWVSRLSEALR